VISDCQTLASSVYPARRDADVYSPASTGSGLNLTQPIGGSGHDTTIDVRFQNMTIGESDRSNDGGMFQGSVELELACRSQDVKIDRCQTLSEEKARLKRHLVDTTDMSRDLLQTTDHGETTTTQLATVNILVCR